MFTLAVKHFATATFQRTFCHTFVVLSLLLPSFASTVEGGGRRPCPDFSPQPTTFPRPDTLLLPSPNFGARANAIPRLDAIVIHTTEGSLATTLSIFQNPASSVSAHFVIASNGDIYEMVDTENRAWHATYYNSRSIGIEMVGNYGNPSTWNESNLGSLVDLLAWTVSAYPDIPLIHPEGNAYDSPSGQLNFSGLVAHGQVQPWNRGDPGEFFPWDEVIDDVAARLASVPEPSTALLLMFGATGLLARRR